MSKFRLSGGMMVFLGAFLWSLCSPLVKSLDVDAFLILGLRSLLAGLTLTAFIRPKQLQWNGWMLMYVFSYLGLTMAVVVGLTMTSPAIVLGMQYASLIMLFAINFIKTRVFDKNAFIPVCIILAGVVLFMLSDTTGANLAGNLVALSCGVFFGGMTISSKKASGGNPLGLTAVANYFTFLVVTLIFPAKMAGVFVLDGKEWIMMLIQGVIQVGGGYAFYNLGLQRVSPQKATVIALWEVVMGPLWVVLFLHEYPVLLEVVGLVVIMAGIFLDAKLNVSSEESAESTVGSAPKRLSKE